jgi:DNA-binding MarR family transcriptional regulator
MAARRLSRLQRRILKRLMAEYERTQGGTSLAHIDLVQGLRSDKSTISHSLRTLEAQGLIAIGRTPGGKADWVNLTPEGRKLACGVK